MTNYKDKQKEFERRVKEALTFDQSMRITDILIRDLFTSWKELVEEIERVKGAKFFCSMCESLYENATCQRRWDCHQCSEFNRVATGG